MSFFVSKELHDKIDKDNLYNENIVSISYNNNDVLNGILCQAKKNKIVIKSKLEINSTLLTLILEKKECNISYNDINLNGYINAYKSDRKNNYKYIVLKIKDLDYERN
jgi:hypothetical protein